MSVQGEIFRWVRGFPSWKQELFIRAAAAPRLAEKDIVEVADLLLGEAGEEVRPREIKQEDLAQAESADEPMAIGRITGLRNVNALDAGQTLAFEPSGVNVVYGANGAGKTGYSRVLRKAGRTLYREDVLSNVYSDGSGGPVATLVVKVGDAERREELDLEAEPPQWLSRICIADYRAGEIYLKEETEVDYVPATLASLSRLATGLMEVKAELQRRRKDVDVPDLDPRLFGEGTRAARFMAALKADDSEEDLRELAKLDADEERTRVGLRKTLAEIEAMQAPQLRAAAERDVAATERLRRELEQVGLFVGTEGVEEVQELEKALAVASEAAEMAAQEFACEPLGAIGSDPWRLLWSAAREYAAHLGQPLPADHDPAHCPLCMQELSPAGRARLHSFEEFVTGDVSNRLTERREQKETTIAVLPDVGALRERHLDAIERLGTEPGDLGLAIIGWLAAAGSRLDLIRAGDVSGLSSLGASPDLGQWIAAHEEEAARQAAIEADEGHEEVRVQLAELEGRRRLAGRLDDALAQLRALQKVARIKVAVGQTGTGTVSQKVRSLSQELIQAGLGKALARQLAALEFRDIEVVATSRIVRGKPVAGLSFKAVGGVRLTDVLSQGEQRRLALAMFLAEMEVRSDVSPVVFDDPTSSIDQEGRRRIARTLMKLGETRQVIVFTHELSLVQELQRHASPACAVHAQHIKRLGKTVGHVQSDLPWDGLPVKARRGQLGKMHAVLKTKYEENDDEIYARWAADFCNRLRAAFERAVEDSVLAGVVTRRKDDVQTKKLPAINWNEEICELVDRGMSETSPWVHDRPLADGSSPPAPDELKEGLDILGELLDATAAVRKAREAAEKKTKSVQETPLKQLDLAPVPDPGPDGTPEPHLRSVPD
jgi:ABC-type uncharacterized transport system ATPase subunit